MLAQLTTPAAPVVKDKQPRVEREERNGGVRRPIKGLCAEVWQALDELRAKGEDDLTTTIRSIGEKRGWNRNNVSIELFAYRRFHGIARPTSGA